MNTEQTQSAESGAEQLAKLLIKPVVDAERVRKAEQIRQEYRNGKQNLEQRVIAAEKWYRQQHWECERDTSKRKKHTGWLFASITNKHGDFMDNMPEVSVLARERGDEQTAKQLTDIFPVLLDRTEWKKRYSEGVYDKIKSGTGIYAVLWDPAAYGGLGDISVTNVDILNCYWEPGVEDIQDSANFFVTELVDREFLKKKYASVEGIDRLSHAPDTSNQYEYEDQVDTTKKATVVNWYYRTTDDAGKTLLHYSRYTADIVLYASENDDNYAQNGWYAHGMYPFVFDVCFPEKGSPAGFGIIDAMKDTQTDIDEANALMMRNLKEAAKRRYFMSDAAAVNEEEFRDADKDIIHVGGTVDDIHIREISANPLSGVYYNLFESKVNELKENSFNRDVNSGGSSGTTTASGIAALQEAGSKPSRDMISQSYEAFKRICVMVIELIRQFYDVPRYFRILGDNKEAKYVPFDNTGLTGVPIGDDFGQEYKTKEPVFDLDVKVSKQNAWSKAAQNQDVIALFNMGMFNPENSTQALAFLEVFEVENKDKLTQIIQKNGLKEQFIAQFLPMLIQAAMMSNPQLAVAAQNAAVAAGIIQPAPAPMEGAPADGVTRTAETDVNGQIKRSNAYMDKQRATANARTAPV